MLRYVLLLLVITVCLVVSTACETLGGAMTPAQAARQFHVRDVPESAPTFRVVATRPWERGVVILYAYLRPARDQVPPLHVFGYDLVEHRGGGSWSITGGGEGGTPLLPPAEKLISYSTGSGWNRVRGDFSIVYGQSLAPQVASVEATFDNGLVLRDGTGDGFFVLITPTKAAPCELRALDVQSGVLQRIDVAAPAKASGISEDNCPAGGA